MSRKSDSKHPKERMVPRMRRYCVAFIETLDGALSAEMAGYSKKSANDISKSLQRHPAVRAMIDKGLEERERELKLRCVKVMEHTYGQAIADIGDIFGEDGYPLPMNEMPRWARRAIASVEVELCEQTVTVKEGDKYVERYVKVPKLAKIKLHDKRASQELFARYAGKLKDKVELDATKSFEQVVLEAARMRRERAGAAAEAQTEDADT